MADRDGGALTVQLPRLPGTKEPRWAHLLCGEPVLEQTHEPERASAAAQEQQSRMALLEQQVTALREEMHELRQMLDHLRRSLGE